MSPNHHFVAFVGVAGVVVGAAKNILMNMRSAVRPCPAFRADFAALLAIVANSFSGGYENDRDNGLDPGEVQPKQWGFIGRDPRFLVYGRILERRLASSNVRV